MLKISYTFYIHFYWWIFLTFSCVTKSQWNVPPHWINLGYRSHIPTLIKELVFESVVIEA